MKKFFILLPILVLFFFFANAQQNAKKANPVKQSDSREANFWDVQKAFQEYTEGKEQGQAGEENEEDGEYMQFKRWEAFAKQRMYPSGNFPNPEILFNEYRKFRQSEASQKGADVFSSTWSFVGPHVIPDSGGGSGRLNCIALNPVNPNIIWVGAACGGLWKSTNGGATWSSNTDLLPSISISDIVIDPTNPQIMYLATGDKYGIYYGYKTWGQYSAGVLKSTDGGVTWNTTGLNYTLDKVSVIQRLVLDSLHPNILFAATLKGLFKTTDGGAVWTNIKLGKFYDVEFHPTHHDTMYLGDSTKLFRSTNGGTTWVGTTAVSQGRISIAVCKAFPNTVYAWSSNGLYYSNNSGVSFTARTDPGSQCTPYGYYDRVIDVSPINENVLVTGGLEIARSTDGGISWTNVSDWNTYPQPNYVHGDQHALLFAPGSSTKIYAGNDGGLFKTADQCSTWTDLSAGIDIKQYYRICSSFLTPTTIYGGAQDNGTDRVKGLNSAKRIYGADGQDCLVDFTNDNIVIASTQMGYFKRSTDGGATFTPISVTGCDWTSPIVMDPSNHNNIYIGGSSVIKSADNGVTWSYLPGQFDFTCVYSIEVAPSNSNYIYAATLGNIYRTVDGGTNWTTLTGTLPVGSAAITGIAISSSDPDKVWVTFSGFSAGKKVYRSTNGGTSWTNVSGTLPNIPVNCIEYQKGSNDIVYIGTDMGVFGTDGTLTDWVPHNNGLPNVIVYDLEAYTPTNKLRAGTFGRGIWEVDLKTSMVSGIAENPQSHISVYPNPSTGTFRVEHSGVNVISAEVYNVFGQNIYSASPLSLSATIDISSYPNGIYFLRVKTDIGDAIQKLVVQH